MVARLVDYRSDFEGPIMKYWGQWHFRYAFAIVCVILGILLRIAITQWVGPGLPLFITIYPAIMFSALYGGIWPGIVTTLVAGFIMDYWFVPPFGILKYAHRVDLVSLVLFVSMGVFMCIIGGIVRNMRFYLEWMVRERTREIQEKHELLQLSQHAAHIGVFEWNVKTNVHTWSPELEMMYGLEVGQFGKTLAAWELLVYPQDRKAAIALVSRALQTGQLVEGEWRILWPDGSIRWILGRFKCFKDASGKPLRLMGVNIDITERKKTMEALQESEERFRYLVENVQDYAIFLLDPQGFVVTWNGGAQRLKGYSEEEIKGKHFSLFYLPENRRECEQELNIAATEGHFSSEGWRLRKDGSRFWASVTITALRNNVGVLHGFTKLVRDITEHKKAEDKLRTLANDLASSNKELESFSYSVSHDLRAPLQTLKGFSRILFEGYSEKLGTEGQDFLRKIFTSTEKMSELIDALLSLSKISYQEISPRRISLSAIAQEVVNELRQAELIKNIEVNVAENVVAYGDPHLLRIALSNLIGNACKFSSKNPGARIEFGEMQKEGKKLYYVHDTGAGFDMKFVDKLFEPFKRLHSAREFSGTGIGLATVRRVIEKHGGSIWAESEVGKGATFYFTLPDGLQAKFPKSVS
jgi:PAS domain S-box-containing protein